MELEARIRRLEDRAAISETVIRYCLAVDRRDWAMFERCFTDPVLTDHVDGHPTGSMPRAAFVERVSTALDGFDETQHLSPNHVIEFDPDDPDRAVCLSAMYAQHRLAGSQNGEFFLLRAQYTDYLRRTPDGWRIEGLETAGRWTEGNEHAVEEAISRSRGLPAETL